MGLNRISLRWLAAGAVAVTLLWGLARIGGDEGNGGAAAGGKAAACAPVEVDAPPAASPAERGDALKGLGVSVTVKEVLTPDEIEDKFANFGRFEAAEGSRFVVVVYEFRNLSDGPREAANTINKSFVLSDGRRAWLRADQSPRCPVPSASLAVSIDDGTSPEGELDPGEDYVSVVVYSVPEGAGDLSWTGFGRSVGLGDAD